MKGSIAGLNNAVIDVKTLVSKVQYKAHIVDKPGMTNFFKEETGKQLMKTIENDHKVNNTRILFYYIAFAQMLNIKIIQGSR